MKRSIIVVLLLIASCFSQSTKLDMTTQMSAPGTTGQLLYNNGGAVGAEDPVISLGQPARTTGTIVNAASTVAAATLVGSSSYGVATVTFNGTYAGVTVVFEFSDDSGTTYYSTSCVDTSSGTVISSVTLGTNALKSYDCGVFATTNLRVRATAWTSGTANVGITVSAASIEPAPSVVQGTAAALASAWPVKVTDGVNSMPTGDATARSVFTRLTDGTTNVAVIASTTALKTDISSVGGSAVSTSNTGVQKVGVVGNAGASIDATLGTTLPTNNVAVANVPTTASGAACAVGNAASLTVLGIKASAGNVYGVTVVNKTASVIYLQFYNTAGTPTLGTSVISWIPVAASATLVIPPGTLALSNFATGIGIGASTTPTSTGTPGTAPDVSIWFK